MQIGRPSSAGREGYLTITSDHVAPFVEGKLVVTRKIDEIPTYHMDLIAWVLSEGFPITKVVVDIVDLVDHFSRTLVNSVGEIELLTGDEVELTIITALKFFYRHVKHHVVGLPWNPPDLLCLLQVLKVVVTIILLVAGTNGDVYDRCQLRQYLPLTDLDETGIQHLISELVIPLTVTKGGISQGSCY